MSRLARLEEKKNIRKAFLLMLGTVFLIILTILVGIPALIRMAAFLGDLRASSRPVDKTDIVPPAPPRMSLPYEATNSATQVIDGAAESGATIFLTLNGESLGTVVSREDGTFIFSRVELRQGDNSLMAVAVDQAGNKSRESAPISLYYSNKSPDLNIESPTDRQQISGNKIEIKGSVADSSRLMINDRLIVVGSNGKFSTVWSLNSGENELVFVATDRAGNQTRKELTVTATP